ncbi:hypothetical protein [Mesorhizobium sp. M0998]|uniref:hypothetical protein n=1 Tax=Mesorhizobium sp. M0998 TaxID=2957044 RepID=UPI003337D113
MVDFARIPGTHIFADVPDACRLLFRPANPLDDGTIHIALTTALAQQGFIWILKSATPPNQLMTIIDELDDLAQRQDAAPANALPRVIFGHTDGAWSAVHGRRTGNVGGLSGNDAITFSITRNESISYRLQVTPATLAVEQDALTLRSIEPNAHRFRKFISGAPYKPVSTKLLTIPLTGLAAGTIVADAAAAPDVVDELGLEIRFSQVSKPYEVGGETKRDVLTRRARPLRAGSADGQKPIGLRLVLDPLDPFDQNRSFVEPVPAAGEEGFLSGFVTNAGHDILLVPRRQEAAAVGGAPSGPAYFFTRHPGEVDDTTAISLYEETLSLRGHFDVRVPGNPTADPTQFGLMPGPAASEVIPFSSTTAEAAGPTVMSFDLGPSLDMRLPAGDGQEAAHDDDQEAFQFTAAGKLEGVTSWIRIANLPDGEERRAMRLITEPAAYRRLGGTEGYVQVHDPVFMATGSPRAPEMAAGFVPVLPIRGHIADDPKELWDFQRNVLAVERAKLLTTGAPRPEAALRGEALIRKRTPLGFEIEQQGENGPITAVRFARSVALEIGQTTVDVSFGLAGEPPPSPLLPPVVDALVRNRLFLVLNRAPRYTGPGWGATLEQRIGIAGWSFDVDLARPGREEPARVDTLVIVKGYEGHSIVDLAADPKAWSSPDAFLGGATGPDDPLSVRVATAQKILKDFLDKVKGYANSRSPDGEPTRLLYQDIDAIVRNANWSGVLAINVPLGVANLPTQLKGLMGGVDLAKLKAEYVAVETTPLGPNPKNQPMARLAALVDYQDEEPARETQGSHYGFRVRRMQALFANGELRVFNTSLRLLLGSLFEGTGSIKQGPRGSTPSTPADFNNIELIGRYERRREGTDTREIYTFETANAYRYEATFDKAFIKSVDLDRVAYVTDRSTDVGHTVLVESRFVLDGNMEFGKIGLGSVADILDVDKIDFSDLDIGLDFHLPKIPMPKWDLSQLLPNFTFSPPNIRFDFDRYKRRSADGGVRGFLSSFPLKLSGFGWFPKGASLGSLGFFSFEGFGAGNPFKFALEFDLDMGSLGALAGKLKAFKMKFLFGFKENAGAATDWGFGFKFDNSGGDGLEIGIEGVLKLISRKYGLLSKKYPARNGNEADVKLIYSLGTELQVFGHSLPPGSNGMTLLLFVDPKAFADPQSRASAVGWFAGLVPSSGSIAGDALELELLALGQRVDPIHGLSPSTTRELVDALKRLMPDLGDGDNGDPEKAIEQTVALLDKNVVGFDPNVGWSVGFRGTFFKIVAIDFAMRDPTLYGLRVAVMLGEGAELFSVDVLYRRLTDKLGVYSLEFVPPSSWRQLEFGAVSVTLPAIAFEIFTDGGFTIDLGYPRNNDFSRSFGVQFLPFIGSGGLYFRRVSGPAARLIPSTLAYLNENHQLIWDEQADFLLYKPVIEAGVAFRVGLGKEIVKGPLRVGLAVTVFATLEGGYGVLYFPGTAVETRAARTFIRVRGTVGILGELYGYVDFGIIKAGVSIRIWVAIGLDFRTHFKTKLFIQAGVSVSVEVVIAEFKVFGHRVRISIHFSFATTIEYATYVGSDGPIEYYRFSTAEIGMLEIAGQSPLLLLMPQAADWTPNLTPADWRQAGQDPIRLPLYFSPDFTMARASDSQMVPEAVLLLLCPEIDSTGRPTSLGDLSAALAAWALKATLGADLAVAGAPLREWQLDDETIDRVAAFVAGDGVASDPAKRRLRLPALGQLQDFLAANLHATITSAPAATDEVVIQGVLFPLPPDMRVRRTGFASDHDFDDVALDTKLLVNDSYRDAVDRQFEDFILLDKSRARSTGAETAETPRSLVATLFEEHLGLLIRSAIARLAALARDTDTASVGNLLDLLARVDAEPHKSAGFEIFAGASRLFAHGPRLPLPADMAAVPPNIPRIPENGVHGLYRLAWLQVPLRGATAGTARLSAEINAPWLAEAATVDVPVDDASLAASGAAFRSLQQKGLRGTVATDNLYRLTAKEYAARPALPLADGSIVRFPPELVRALAYSKDETIVPLLGTRNRAVRPQDVQASPDNVQDAIPVIAAEILVRCVADPTVPPGGGPAHLADIVEIVTINENDRVRLDWFENGQHGGAIRSVDILHVGDAGYERSSGAEPPVVIQTNLSTEIRPGQVPELDSAEAARPIAETYIASLGNGGDMTAFVEIVRRAAIVNTGGTFFRQQGIAAGRPAQFSLLMVVGIDPANSLRANAFICPRPVAEEDERIFVITTGEMSVEPLAEPGTWPMIVSRDDSQSTDTLERALSARFSMLAYDVVDGNGTLVGGRDATHSLSIGPTEDGESPPTDAASLHYHYRVPLPLAKLLAAGADPDPYGIVGSKIRMRANWRDIYGNEWPDTDGGQSTLTTVGYIDRIIALNDLPSLVFAWWPGTTAGALKVLIAFDRKRLETLLPQGPDGSGVLSSGQRTTLIDSLDRAALLYARAGQQLADERVSAGVTFRLWQETRQAFSATQKQQLLAFVADGASMYRALLDGLSDPGLVGRPLSDWRERIARIATTDIFASFEFAGLLSKDAFVELTVELGVERPFALVGGQDTFTADQLRDIYRSTTVVSPPFRDDKVAAPPWAASLGADTATVPQLAAALIVAAPDRVCATGYSDIPGLVDRAIWLLRRDALPGIDEYTEVVRTDLAVPPVSTRSHSGDIDVPVFGGTATKPFSFRDADADVYAREALRRIDAVLDPSILKSVASPTAAEALGGVLDAKRELARFFGDTVRPIYADTVISKGIGISASRLLTNRFLRKLAFVYDLDTLVAYGDPKESNDDGGMDVGRQAFGTIGGMAGGAAAQVTFEPFNLALTPGTKHLFVACDATPSDHDADSAGGTVPPPPAFELTHIQRADAGDVSGSEPGDPGRYRPTAWLRLVRPLSLALGDARGVPVCVRRMPRKPAISNENFSYAPVRGGDVAQRMGNARQWATERDWTYEAKNVDQLRLTLRLNGPDDTIATPSGAVFQELDSQKAVAFVRFVAATEGSLTVLGGSDPVAAAGALKFFHERAADLCAELERARKPEAFAAEQVLKFDIAEQLVTANNRKIVVTPVEGGDKMPPLTFGVSVLKGDGSVAQSWQGRTGRLEEGFPEDDGLRDRHRRLGIAGIDILNLRSIRTELDLARNASIDHREVATPFIYRVPTVASGSTTRPLLDHSEDILLADRTDAIGSHFQRLFDGLSPPAGLSDDFFMTDIFVTFEPWLSADGDSVGEGAFVTAWRGGGLTADRQLMQVSLASATAGWLSGHRPPAWPGSNAPGNLVVDVRIFDGLQGSVDAGGTGQCVLRLRRCLIPLSRIS